MGHVLSDSVLLDVTRRLKLDIRRFDTSFGRNNYLFLSGVYLTVVYDQSDPLVVYRCRCKDNETISDEVQIVVSGYPVTLKETGNFISPFTEKPYPSIAKYMKQEMRTTQELPMEFYCYVYRCFVGFLFDIDVVILRTEPPVSPRFR